MELRQCFLVLLKIDGSQSGGVNIQSGRARFKSPLSSERSLAAPSQPTLPHKVIVKVKKGREGNNRLRSDGK